MSSAVTALAAKTQFHGRWGSEAIRAYTEEVFAELAEALALDERMADEPGGVEIPVKSAEDEAVAGAEHVQEASQSHHSPELVGAELACQGRECDSAAIAALANMVARELDA